MSLIQSYVQSSTIPLDVKNYVDDSVQGLRYMLLNGINSHFFNIDVDNITVDNQISINNQTDVNPLLELGNTNNLYDYNTGVYSRYSGGYVGSIYRVANSQFELINEVSPPTTTSSFSNFANLKLQNLNALGTMSVSSTFGCSSSGSFGGNLTISGNNALILQNSSINTTINSLLTTSKTISFPDLSQNDTLLTNTSTSTCTNKSFIDSSTILWNSTDNSKRAKFDCSLISTGQTRNWLFPDFNDTFVGVNNTQTLSNKTINAGILTGMTTIQNNIFCNNQVQNKVICLWDNGTSTDQTQHNYFGFGIAAGILRYQVNNLTSNHVFYAASSSTVSNELFRINNTNLTAQKPLIITPTSNQIILGSTNTTTLNFPAPASSITITYPTTTDTILGRNTTDTVSNKTLLDGSVLFANTTDATKKLQLSLSGLTTATTRTWTIPNSSDTFVGLAATQTLTNKTLASPTISTILNTGTLTLPSSTDTLVARATTDTLSNKTFLDGSCLFANTTDATKKLQLSLSGITTATTRTWTIPDLSDTFVGLTATQTLTNKTLTTPAITNPTITGSNIIISDDAISSTLKFGTGAAVKNVTIGSTNSTSSTTINSSSSVFINAGTYSIVFPDYTIAPYSIKWGTSNSNSQAIGQANTANNYVTSSLAGDMCLRIEPSKSLLIGAWNSMYLKIDSTGAITAPNLSTGVIHSSAAGLLTSSTIVNTDISSSAAIVDTKLATISTAGKILDSSLPSTLSNKTLAGTTSISNCNITNLTTQVTTPNQNCYTLIPLNGFFSSSSGTWSNLGWGQDAPVGMYNSSGAATDYLDWLVGGGVSMPTGVYLFSYSIVVRSTFNSNVNLSVKANGAAFYTSIRGDNSNIAVAEGILNIMTTFIVTTSSTMNVRISIGNSGSNTQIGLSGGINLVQIY